MKKITILWWFCLFAWCRQGDAGWMCGGNRVGNPLFGGFKRNNPSNKNHLLYCKDGLPPISEANTFSMETGNRAWSCTTRTHPPISTSRAPELTFYESHLFNQYKGVKATKCYFIGLRSILFLLGDQQRPRVAAGCLVSPAVNNLYANLSSWTDGSS